MRIMTIENCEKTKLEYSTFCSENDLPDCFSTIVYFMDTQGVNIWVKPSLHGVFSSGYSCSGNIRSHRNGGFEDRQSAELFIAQEAFNYVEHKLVSKW